MSSALITTAPALVRGAVSRCKRSNASAAQAPRGRTFAAGPNLNAHMSGHAQGRAMKVGCNSSTSQHRIVDVELEERSYPIYIGSGYLADEDVLGRHVPSKRCVIITNTTIASFGYLQRVEASLQAAGKQVDSLILPDGEEYKNMENLMKIWDFALETRQDRGTTFIALGGGVIGDMVGFAAATYQRGCNFLQIPTTVMSAVDSSVGGKTAVNHPKGKNMIGAFYQPRAVIIDIDTLKTLPERELSTGLSEVVKYGLIRDPDFLVWQEENMERLMNKDPDALAYAIERSCINKAEVVSSDEKEGQKGLRATLNFGHTFGHAIETGLGYGTWLHGEGVSAGMMMALDLSRRLGWLEGDDETLPERSRELLLRAKLPVYPPPEMSALKFRDLMSLDKKVADGKLRLILLKGLGSSVQTADFDEGKLNDTLTLYPREERI